VTAHDPACCLEDMPTSECPACASIALARGEEIATRERIWKDNLPSIARRNYAEGFKDATEHRASRYE